MQLFKKPRQLHSSNTCLQSALYESGHVMADAVSASLRVLCGSRVKGADLQVDVVSSS